LRHEARVAVDAVPALLVPARCSITDDQKPVEFLLSDQAVPAQNEAFQDPINRQISCFSGKLVPAQVQSHLRKNPGAKSTKTPPTSLLGGVFVHWKWQTLKPHDVAEGRHSNDGRSSGERNGSILHRLVWDVLTASHL